MSDKARAHIFVTGLVQGVFYRSNTADLAQGMGLTGWVRNLPDGRVELVAEGDVERVRELEEWCWKGPPASRVEDVTVEWEEPTGEFACFSVTYA